jgi:hypothetical protein
MLVLVDPLHRIEALPGHSRYAVTFRRSDGSEHTTTVELRGDAIVVAEASLPDGWATGSPARSALRDAILAVDGARSVVPTLAELRDVPGGWDVGLGNVVISTASGPECTAHGVMRAGPHGEYDCADCGARALYGQR